VSGINQTIMTSLHCFLDIQLKEYSHALNCKKPVSAFSAKKGGVEVAYATKKGSAQDIHRATSHVPISHLSPLPLCPPGAF
jgi:hypothetical protein